LFVAFYQGCVQLTWVRGYLTGIVALRGDELRVLGLNGREKHSAGTFRVYPFLFYIWCVAVLAD
jgi:hypothetical protein